MLIFSLIFSSDAPAGREEPNGQIRWLDLLAAAQQHRALHRVLQLAHVSRPWILHQSAHRRRRKSGHLLAIAGTVAIEKMRRQQRNIFAPVAQRRQMNLHSIETEQQVFAEVARRRPLRCSCALVAESNAHIHAPRLRRAHALQFSGLKHAQQFGLLAKRYVGDLIQKQRAAVGELKAPDAIGSRIGKRAFHVTENSLSNVPSGIPPALTATSAMRARGDAACSSLRNDLLAGAMLTCYQHVGVRWADLRNQFQYRLHRGRRRNELRHAFGAQQAVLKLQLPRPAQRLVQFRVHADQATAAARFPTASA